MLITPQELPKEDPNLDAYINYCNYQLEKSNGYSIIVFSTDFIPKSAHDFLVKEAYKRGWYLTIEQTKGFYEWEACYKFTFTPIR